MQVGAAWAPFAELAKSAKVASSWSVPVLGPGGLLGVITVFRATAGKPRRDDLDLATLYAGYVASAIERDRLLDEVTSRNRVLETIREMLETLAGPIPVADGLGIALQLLRRGLEADEVALIVRPPDGPPTCRASDGVADPADPDAKDDGPAASPAARHAAAAALTRAGQADVAVQPSCTDRDWLLSVAFPAPGGLAALVARWQAGPAAADSAALLEDAAHSLRLALEREEAWFANQETAALRRSRELQRGFLSRLSHELRTPLTAIKGYASSLLQTDVTWDDESEQRFLTRIAAESSRLGRLVDDLLRFSAIESGILQLQRDWCDIPLVLDAAIACLPPSGALLVGVRCAADLPPIWADHDRLEQVFVNLLTNAVGHNPPGTRVMVTASADGPDTVLVSVADNGPGMQPDVAQAPFEPMRRRRSPSSGSGLGLSIARGIVEAHGGRMELVQPVQGTCFRILLPVENPDSQAAIGTAATDDTEEPGLAGETGTWPERRGSPGSRGWLTKLRRRRRGEPADMLKQAGNTRALVVEDDPNIVDLIRSNLAVRGFDTVVSVDGLRALNLLETEEPDIVLLDLMLPEVDGFELCQLIRERSSVAIIVVSARGGERDKVTALNMGADDYLTKPFSIEELLARITATLRRTRPAETAPQSRPARDHHWPAGDRPGQSAGPPGRRGGAPHPDGIRAAARAGHQPGEAADPRAPAAPGLGPRL